MATAQLTNITPPRVPLLDPKTGLVSREWYRFFLNLFVLTGSGQNTASLTDLQVGPPMPTQEDFGEIVIGIDSLKTQPTQESALDQIAELQKQIQALEVQPVVDVAAINAAIAALLSAPVTKTADFTVAAGETWLINNKSGSTCTVTLPTPSTSTGRVLNFQNYQAQTLVSASSNVVPLAGGSAGTAILQAVTGANATLVSDGTSWIMTKYDSNNSLELE
jgi:hypothetical protein